jgi:hypothetical protein
LLPRLRPGSHTVELLANDGTARSGSAGRILTILDGGIEPIRSGRPGARCYVLLLLALIILLSLRWWFLTHRVAATKPSGSSTA